MANHDESFRVSKICQIWEHILQLPNISLSASVSEQLVNWIEEVLRHSNQLVLTDILSCLAVAVTLKEIKQAKVSQNYQLKNLIGIKIQAIIYPT